MIPVVRIGPFLLDSDNRTVLQQTQSKLLSMLEIIIIRFALIHSAEIFEKTVCIKSFATEFVYYSITL